MTDETGADTTEVFRTEVAAIEARLNGLSNSLVSPQLVSDTAVGFAGAAAEINRLLTRTLIMAERAVEAAVAEGQRRADALVAQAEEHARIVGDRARNLINQGLEEHHRELTAAVTESHGRLIALLEEAARRLETAPAGTVRDPEHQEFFSQLRHAIGATAPEPAPPPRHGRHSHRWQGAGSFGHPTA